MRDDLIAKYGHIVMAWANGEMTYKEASKKIGRRIGTVNWLASLMNVGPKRNKRAA